MTTHYFCYEQCLTGRWLPVVYHGEKPGKAMNGPTPARTTLQPIPADCIDIDGTPLFGRLAKLYPFEAQKR